MDEHELQGTLLWQPGPPDDSTVMGRFIAWLRERRGLDVVDFDALWRWSVDDIAAFWGAAAEFFGVIFHDPPRHVIEQIAMPATGWFEGATLNYAEQALVGDPDALVLISHSQTRPPVELTRGELRAEVARVRAGLQRLGVSRGDRVAAYLPNIAETTIAFLATASLGAIWASCAPEFGVRSVVDRLRQIEPKVLLAVDGYRFGPRVFDRTADIDQFRHELPSLEHVVMLPYLDASRPVPAWARSWTDVFAEDAPLQIDPVPFDHPIYILYSSGTTGLPKPIVHGHGGIVVEHMKWLHLHGDLGPADRFFQFSTTGWMAWNLSVSALLCGSGLVVYDGNPLHPDLGTLWRVIADTGVTHFGIAAPFLLTCRKAGLVPNDVADLSALRAVTSSGAPLPAAGFTWVYENVGHDVMLASASGGTDVCSAFVGMNPLVPVYAGEISRPFLGARVEAWSEDGRPLIGEQGELVLTVPMPSMPVSFWNDPDGARYHASYFERFPGVWCHGDWITITERGTCVISGRSDATLNRGGVRLGTSEFYAVVEELDEIVDSLVVHLEDSGGGLGDLILFVQLVPSCQLDDDLRARIAATLREKLSPRHVPNEIVPVAAVARNITGKKMEVPVKRLLLGTLADTRATFTSLADPAALTAVEAYAAERVAPQARAGAEPLRA